jgi:hypothetical protein
MSRIDSFQILTRTGFLALSALLGFVLMSPGLANGQDDRNSDSRGSDWIGDDDLDQGVPWDSETCQGDSFPADSLRGQQEVFDCGDDFSDCLELPRAASSCDQGGTPNYSSLPRGLPGETQAAEKMGDLGFSVPALG